MKAPVDGRDRACPPCDATGRLLTFEPLDGMAATSRAAGILAIVGDADTAIAAEQAAGYFRDQLIDALEVTVAK